MHKVFGSVIISLLFAIGLQAQIPNPYLFIDWKDKDNYELLAGDLTYQDSFEVNVNSNSKSYVSSADSESIYHNAIEENIKEISSEKPDLLFYIHGFGAHRKYFVKLNNAAIQRDISAKVGSTIGMQLTYSWSVGYNYVGGIPKVIDIGEYYGGLMAETIRKAKAKNPKTKVYLITHSMGNRLFLGIFKRLREEFDIPIIDEHIMAAPDIEPTIFDEGQPLREVSKLTKRISVYRHNTDRILTVSGQLTETERIGLTGLSDEQLDNVSSSIKIVDCSLLNDNEKFDMGNHNYYYQSPTVRKDIFNVLMNRDEDLAFTRKSLKHPRRFVLQFKEIEKSVIKSKFGGF